MSDWESRCNQGAEKPNDYVGKRKEYMEWSRERLIEALINKEELLKDAEQTIEDLNVRINDLQEEICIARS